MAESTDLTLPRRPWERIFRAIVYGRLAKAILGRRRPVLIIPVIVLTAVVVAGITAPWIAPHHPTRGNLRDRLVPPVWGGEQISLKVVVEGQLDIGAGHRQITLDDARKIQEDAVVGGEVGIVTRAGGSTKYLLGTDHLGRDILTRIIYGARISLIMAVLTLLVGGSIGVTAGLVAGWYGGWIDELIMRAVDIILALPIILIALVLVVSLGSSFQLIIVILAIAIWPLFSRVTRGEVLRVKDMDYVALARVSGASTLRIMFVHILPGVTNSVIVVATLLVGVIILLEAALSFLGAGVPSPTPAWGSMLAEGRDRIAVAWWISALPGIAIFLTVLSLNLFGDWLRDALDPKLRHLE